jgi:hypothetical protein
VPLRVKFIQFHIRRQRPLGAGQVLQSNQRFPTGDTFRFLKDLANVGSRTSGASFHVSSAVRWKAEFSPTPFFRRDRLSRWIRQIPTCYS